MKRRTTWYCEDNMGGVEFIMTCHIRPVYYAATQPIALLTT